MRAPVLRTPKAAARCVAVAASLGNKRAPEGPIWRGGGVTHGPRNAKLYAKKINQKMRRKALLVVLSRKYKDGEVLFVDALKFVAPKAAEAKKFLEALNLQKRSNAALIVMPERHLPTERSFGNFGNVVVSPLADINPLLVLGKKRVVFVDPKAALETLAKKI